MPAMHKQVVEDLCNKVDQMKYRHMCLAEFHMTHLECLQTIAHPDHIEPLMSLANIAKVSVAEEWVAVPTPFKLDGVERNITVMFYMRTHEGKLPPLLPRFANWRNPDAGITARVANWVQQRLIHGRLSATTKEVIKYLAGVCDTGQQIRYLYPAVLHLASLSDDERTRAWVDKFGTHKAVKSTPPIEPHWRKAIVDTSTWLTQASLLDEVTMPAEGPTDINLSYPLPEFKLGPHDVFRN